MPLPVKTRYCDAQEAIDRYKSRYNKIINEDLKEKRKEDKLAIYASELRDFLSIATEEQRKMIKTLSNGEYHINIKNFVGSQEYRLEIRKRKENEDIGATEEQILELQNFLVYLENEDVIKRLKKIKRQQTITLLFILPIPMYIIVHFVLAKSYILQILFLIFIIIVYIAGIRQAIKPDPYF